MGDLDDPAFARLFGRLADKRVVLLGESSHGTAEFYRARARITEHPIRHHGFTIVAVETNWPDALSIDRYVRDRPAAVARRPPFSRFPTWMGRNTEMLDFIERLHAWLAASSRGLWPAPARRRKLPRRRAQRQAGSRTPSW
ncbi:MAG TPA: erythromycin esterase family protein [Azospirillaceae bacterium]|nr:erythromycin esterase family protein [Azospirillaceae bacterium]